MKRKIPKMCITCQHYEPYHCTLNDAYIGYLYCDKPNKCKSYRMSDDYKKCGKWYEKEVKNEHNDSV